MLLFGWYWHIEPKSKWPTISWRHFETHFLEWKYINFDKDFIEVCSQGPINNIPALARRRAIIWTNDGKFTDAYMRRLASMS